MLNPGMIMNQIKNDPRIMANPQAKAVMDMYQKHDSEGLEKFITNMAGEYGTDLNTVKTQFGRMFGIK